MNGPNPPGPAEVTTSHHDGVLGRMRARSVGRRRPATPEVVLVQGMGVADYLMPGLLALGRWTRATLVELPGFGGSGDPPHELSVPEFGRCVADWLTAQRLGPVLLAGHSSGTQVAARVAIGRTDVAAVVLASPTVDPAARGPLRLLARWLWDGRREPPGLTRVHRAEWRRAGPRRLVHTARAHLDDALEEAVARLRVPVLVIHGRDDVIGTARWARRLAGLAPDGECVEVPGAHTFPWLDPEAWSEPVRRLSVRVGGGARDG
ncbi:alpha/beta fold hydrolase [Allostreptomyces psammosilenae]|uniref:Pimeloyl-ACP methyl ester carboxylesterase n=1 Tax=Allostreptomyces psammosilenae TaxID=1892865 RepID=A0A852ZSH9_9ACTN|nr:alpha/beta hydrolase [Allostreptomyces psammosilenae]NYI03784.1 pimeloyl-ACP methyl ester carboxylesterase [Allostreptomyces psammosilenae]